MKKIITVRTKRFHSAEITAEDIRKKFKLPEDAKIIQNVDGSDGGFDVEVTPLTATWESAEKDRTI